MLQRFSKSSSSSGRSSPFSHTKTRRPSGPSILGEKTPLLFLRRDGEEQLESDMYTNCDDGSDETFIPRNTIAASQLEEENIIKGPFPFVEYTAFQMFVALVIAVNLILLIEETINMSKGEGNDAMRVRMQKIDDWLLWFYCCELGVRLIHFRLIFFVHPQDKWWNHLDFFIVICGVMDQWVLPFVFQNERSNGIRVLALRSMRFLRAFRVMRLARLVRIIITMDLQWTESFEFQFVVGAVIVLNAIFMGLETDMQDVALWDWVEQAMLIFFVFELSVRLKREGCKFFTESDDAVWNWIDFAIVLSSAIDLWVLRLLAETKTIEGSDPEFGKIMMLVRVLRLLRILRLLRLVRAVRPLYNLAMGIVQAMQSMFWVLVLTFVGLYAFSILTTRVIGHSLLGEDDQIPEDTRKMFGTISDSMFTLFAIMNGQGWRNVSPILIDVPWTKPIFVIFTIYSSWALLSVMTGVVSENMLSVRESQEQKDESAQEERSAVVRQALAEVFAAADKDGGGTLARAEYMEILKSAYHVKKLQRVAPVAVKDLQLIFDWLDVDNSGEIDYQEFLNNFDWLNEPCSGKALLQIEASLKGKASYLQRTLDRVRNDILNFEQMYDDQHQDIMRKVYATLGGFGKDDHRGSASSSQTGGGGEARPGALKPARSMSSLRSATFGSFAGSSD